jgi:hypothetical protein
MPRLRPLMVAMAVVLPACLWTGALAPAAAAPSVGKGEPAIAADAFVDSIGVNVRLGDADAGWAAADQLADARIRHVRVGAANAADDPALPGLLALAGAGLQLDLVAGPDADPAGVAGAAATLPEGVAAVEAKGDAAALRSAIREYPELAAVQLLGTGQGVDAQTHQVDLAGKCPGCITDGLGSGDGVVQITEATVGAGVPEAVAARYLPRLLLGHAGRAVRTYLDGPGGPETGPGLFDTAGKPTPAYHAVARLIALLTDRKHRRDPERLAFELHGAVDGVQHRLLQKADGHFWLALWVEKPSWDPASGRELPVPAQRVDVTFGIPVAGLTAFAPELGPGAGQDLGWRSSIALDVSDQVTLLELLPGRAGAAADEQATRPAAPRPETTAPDVEPQVAAAGQPPPDPTQGAAAAPAAAQEPTPAPGPAAGGPLAFTGSTALSMLVSSLMLMLVGVGALFASRRRYRHRH